ncbi:hypothetical protein J437_LFUL001495 [Ladona fulva]|uniref:Uncharacterized protein n=1 Tax=Ladona fulva TaxID=123851 RepID=A0A8K0NT72_LADFU|nr:hypothetical protein J437_LFUL001495 [Ladona fulva]
MSFKIHILHDHLDKFKENMGAYSEEQGKRFHQDISEFERCYPGQYNKNLMRDYMGAGSSENVMELKVVSAPAINKSTQSAASCLSVTEKAFVLIETATTSHITIYKWHFSEIINYVLRPGSSAGFPEPTAKLSSALLDSEGRIRST